jgi:hypothetical protein
MIPKQGEFSISSNKYFKMIYLGSLLEKTTLDAREAFHEYQDSMMLG